MFISPSWGGPGYQNATVFDIKTMIPLQCIKFLLLLQPVGGDDDYGGNETPVETQPPGEQEVDSAVKEDDVSAAVTMAAADDNEDDEPKSKVPSDVPSSSSDFHVSAETAALWDLPPDYDVYGLNKFESVSRGQEAGWPGKWEEIEEDMTEEQLLYSLQVKGAAMSDQLWQEHWAQFGPGLLTYNWTKSYPKVSFLRLQQATGVTFLHGEVASGSGNESNDISEAVEKLSLNDEQPVIKLKIKLKISKCQN